jgi:hypothetical protein
MLIHDSKIATVAPSIFVNSLFSFLLIIPVFAHYKISFDSQLTLNPIWDSLTVGINNF